MKKEVEFIQISDSHLFEDTRDLLVGLNTEDSLQKVVQKIKKDSYKFDFILATGDIAQDGSPRTYERFYKILKRLNAPQYWIPGNHDCLAAMESTNQSLKENVLVERIEQGNWQIILLDSHIEGRVPGRLTKDQLDFLRKTLEDYPQNFALISFHHPPLKVGSQWLDQQMVANSDDFFEIIEKYSQVRAVLWGHIHQEFDQYIGKVRLLGTPSTCFQFAPHKRKATASQRSEH